ncbi:MAG: HK97-gp10 family putative phage morphogenesis protein [Candidatus Bathyarchaeia archaeon]|jgi:HK97 gp10 family phage protein
MLSWQITFQTEALQSFFQNLPPNLKTAVQNAELTVAERILFTMQTLTPVRTGFLLSTEGIQPQGDWGFTIYARAFYAHYVEFGTRRMSPRLFMTRAIELHRGDLQNEIWSNIAAMIIG